MISYPNINPIAVSLGPIQVHWYGLMYLIGFIAGWWLGRIRAKKPQSGWTQEQVDDLLFYIVLGIILGGRIGYMLFYSFDYLIENPLSVFKVWQGGMSFHGGLLGVLTAMGIYAYKTGKLYFQVTDFIAPLIPIGLGTGRIGNFINGELWGKVTTLPWGIVFPDPRAGDLPRHPSQLYEASLEGLILFLILWFFSAKKRPTKAVSGLFLTCYGVFRFAVEFVRIPDSQLGYLAFNWLTMGQILSLPMITLGIALFGWAYLKRTS
ncbi:prolipoprotein diacylglyceryl transferase [Candidatus Nitrosacidococcus tergens]|uniref:Phosphatidylglycerol--prolipoprotein diacylglyceryl transferase n=1 Tax=Candidatus Nitrosacidococcus tergens TaxID=553981 RepID=A0A7G1Q718_9GAMM|nr:prolipoprotein diacylglyceryl transferase [Candidatus Nitrosacidococcus tergens]CAB1274196.1 phosphatidylglycerol-prolipoprotein diacylglyceryl transferase [Candidatus Nitrosacidococcus tergens]